MEFLNTGQLKHYMSKYGIKPKKKFGQNFLIDNNIIAKIIREADIENKVVVEIGPGMGSLTYNLAQVAKKVIALEIDEHLIPVLHEILGKYPNVEIINQDVLKANLDELLKGLGVEERYSIVANLPYYITTPIIMHILENGFNIDKLVFMVQKEVADRMMAKPGTKDYGALTIGVQYYTEVSLIAKVPPTVFIPKPEVHSAVVKMTKRDAPPVKVNEKIFFQVVKAGFGKRRKTILNSLVNSPYGFSKDMVIEACAAAGIDIKKRIEQLSIEEIASLANHFR